MAVSDKLLYMKNEDIFPILAAGSKEAVDRLKKIKSRNLTLNGDLIEKVTSIVNAVRAEGDAALIRFTREFDGVQLAKIRVPKEEIEKARE